MALAKAVISPTVSPRRRMAVTAAANWAGVASPRRQAVKKTLRVFLGERLAVRKAREQGFEGGRHQAGARALLSFRKLPRRA